MNIAIFFICFSASIIGTVCGIGGGVIIKPSLDSFGFLDVVSISFLSGTCVLAMSSYSVLKSKLSKANIIKKRTSFPLAIGASLGGIIGKYLFNYIKEISNRAEKIGGIQALILGLITILTLIYTIYKDKIKSYKIINIYLCFIIGLVLGIMSSFLGIGGGPINLVVLYFFFTMSTKEAVENSIYIIFFSQLASLLQGIFTRTIPDFSFSTLIIMVFAGVLGAFVGKKINSKIDNKIVESLFIILMSLLILLNIYNIYKYFL